MTVHQPSQALAPKCPETDSQAITEEVVVSIIDDKASTGARSDEFAALSSHGVRFRTDFDPRAIGKIAESGILTVEL